MEPITRREMYLAAAAGYDVDPPKPITREEVFLAKLAGMDVETPVPYTRRERFIEEAAVAANKAVIEPLTVTENGTYTAPAGVDGYNPVTVDVPAPEVKLQDKTITENGEYTADSGFDGLGKVTVDVASAGGGESGLYWKYGDYAPPNHYYQKWFTYKGELYAMTRTGSNPGNEANVYKFSGGKWVTVISNTTILSLAAPNNWNFIELNGMIHMIGNEKKYHYVFNGTSISSKSNIPNYISNNASFVQDGKLKAYSYYDGKVYVWNETGDTWAVEATIGSKYEYYYFYTVGNEVYSIYSGKLYKYGNGAVTYICAANTPTGAQAFGGYLYLYGNSYSSANNTFWTVWRKLDLTTNTLTEIGRGAYGDSNNSTFVKDGKLYFIFGDPNAKTNVSVMHEVTE